MSRAYEHILCAVEDGIMQMLNRPDKLNAHRYRHHGDRAGCGL